MGGGCLHALLVHAVLHLLEGASQQQHLVLDTLDT